MAAVTVTVNGLDYEPTPIYENPHQQPTFALGWITSGAEDHMFTMSAFGSMWYDLAHGFGQMRATIGMISSPRLASARNELVKEFLRTKDVDGLPMHYLLMSDVDMVWDDDAIHTAIALSQKHDVPILGGLCYAGRPSAPFATIYKAVEIIEPGTGRRLPSTERWTDEIPYDTMMDVGATGTGWLLIHRNVLHRMALPHPQGFGTTPAGAMNDAIWFEDRGGAFGEDVAFCLKARAVGAKIGVHTGLEIGHRKMVTMDRDYVEEHTVRTEGVRVV
jgi:GT2 family glycosyltransferase